ncbi:MAG TPA: META domain-containing protein [Burkholderiales bacterium]|nr:META domain-containing protein [Burkholderiales bacterium]
MRSRRRRLRYAPPRIAGALAILLAGCTVPPPEEAAREAPVVKVPVSGADGRWELVTSSFIGTGRIPGVPRATLAFEDGRVAVFSGCNRASGPAFHVEGRLEVAPLNATRRACPEPLATFEARFFKLLQSRPVYHLEGETLLLLDGGQSARFRPEPRSGAGKS